MLIRDCDVGGFCIVRLVHSYGEGAGELACFFFCFFLYDATATNQRALTLTWWLWVTVSRFCVFQSVTLQLFMTLKRKRQVQRSKRLNIFFLFFLRWMSAQALCSPSAVAPTSSTGGAEGHRVLAPASGSCVASHMFSVIMSGCVILPAGCSSQRKKPCMKFYQLVNTSSVIIPQCIGALTWIDFFCILRILTASTVAAVDTDCTGVFYAVFLTLLVSTVTFLSPLNLFSVELCLSDWQRHAHCSAMVY